MTHGSEHRQRSRHITVRLSLDEREQIDLAADRAGLTAGSYIRQRVLEGPLERQVRRPPVERRELARLLGEFGKIGGNLNQIAKSMNSGVLVYDNEIGAAISDLRAMRDALLTALGRQT